MFGRYREERIRNGSQSAVRVSPTPPKPSSLGDGSGANKHDLLQGVPFGLQGRNNGRGFQRDDPYQTFNDLPVELIALILETVLNEVTNLPYFQGGYYLGTLKALAAVCRTWKLIIQSTPSFWAVIESNATSREVQYILRKAEKYALTFRHVTQTIPGRPTSRFAKQDFLALAKFNMYRCSSLSVWVEDDKQAAYILTSPAPVLRKATVIASKCLPNQSINLFDGRAPMLEDLNLSRIPIKWDVGLLPSLRRIKLSYGSASTAEPPHPHKVVSALSSCAGIEVVDLCGPTLVNSWFHWADLGLQETIVELPMLNELRIKDMSIAGSSYIIGNIWAPALRNLQVKEAVHQGTVSPLLQPPSNLLLESLRRALARNKILSFNMGPNHISIKITGADGHVDLMFNCTDPDALGRWFVEEFAAELSTVPELELVTSFTRPEPGLQVLQKVLEAVKNPVRFSCPGAKAVADVLAEHLTWPHETSDGPRWHWPELRHLRIDGAYRWHEVALIMFRERYGGSQKEDENTSEVGGTKREHHPCRLTTLTLPGLNYWQPQTFREIASMVGKGVLEGADFQSGWGDLDCAE